MTDTLSNKVVDTQEALDAALCALASHLLRIKAFDDDNTCAAYERVASILSALSTTHEAEVVEPGFKPTFSSILPRFADDDSDEPTSHEIMIHGTIEMPANEGDPHQLYDRAKKVIAAWNAALSSDKTVELLNRCRVSVEHDRDQRLGLGLPVDEQEETLARIDSHLGEMK